MTDDNRAARRVAGNDGAMINLDDLNRILDMVRDHELAEFEFEQDGVRIRTKKDGQVVVQQAPLGMAQAAQPGPVPAAVPGRPLEAAAPEIDVDVELAIVKSPIVGTFYRAPDPNAPPFVQPGDTVKQGQTLCIIEAMKMMNNIDSEYSGTVMKVYAENGQPVQFGERLFAIKRA